MENTILTVSDFIALTNQTLDYAYPNVTLEGEVSSYKVSSGKYVFFDIKDNQSSIGCFMMLFSLRVPITDGMRVIIVASPKLTNWGKFSLTVKSIRLSGEGSIKKSFELLKQKLDKEGLFNDSRKRQLPYPPSRVAVISSTGAAGYADFIKILSDRWGGLYIEVADVQVQGNESANQIINALEYFNAKEDLPEVIAIVRGGGSLEDLATFNDEQLVRAVAASRVPVLVGVGHETDETLVDMVADVRAATPSNAAQLLVPDKKDTIMLIKTKNRLLVTNIENQIEKLSADCLSIIEKGTELLEYEINKIQNVVSLTKQVIEQLSPQRVLQRGYSITRGLLKPGQEIEIETIGSVAKALVKEVYEK